MTRDLASRAASGGSRIAGEARGRGGRRKRGTGRRRAAKVAKNTLQGSRHACSSRSCYAAAAFGDHNAHRAESTRVPTSAFGGDGLLAGGAGVLLLGVRCELVIDSHCVT
ncbi:hypothetical protein JKP88DRAFT_255795 [Tribonema minus]|uniref:Uncharacterized protein n=1 Tax=Tribonema minus TaxID=303371 RepID=A0A836CH13_9STRA|nr:hypothetical protein JKP88DRAFT_255795 [Tribonema minus]